MKKSLLLSAVLALAVLLAGVSRSHAANSDCSSYPCITKAPVYTDEERKMHRKKCRNRCNFRCRVKSGWIPGTVAGPQADNMVKFHRCMRKSGKECLKICERSFQ